MSRIKDTLNETKIEIESISKALFDTAVNNLYEIGNDEIYRLSDRLDAVVRNIEYEIEYGLDEITDKPNDTLENRGE